MDGAEKAGNLKRNQEETEDKWVTPSGIDALGRQVNRASWFNIVRNKLSFGSLKESIERFRNPSFEPF